MSGFWAKMSTFWQKSALKMQKLQGFLQFFTLKMVSGKW